MQSTNHLLMIRPVAFTFNVQTASNNSFQNPNVANSQTQTLALQEFDNFVQKLTEVGVNVTVINDTLEPHTPDSIFPNNWISFHNNGLIAVYPMFATNRRVERRFDVLDKLGDLFTLDEIQDYTASEKDNQFLEGTGSMVLDRENKICYACLSPRTDKSLLERFCTDFGYRLIDFIANDGNGSAIYHTNVVMSVTSNFMIICTECIPNKAEVAAVLATTKKQIIEISLAQLNQFAGNVLEVLGTDNKKYLVMSEQAFKAYNQNQIAEIEKHNAILQAPLYTIESNGGGSARCMMAEIFLTPKAKSVEGK
ncbi:MAG: citrulline utilization hydrolase CtlX [Candidatus Methylacidiphilales bacterium]